MGVEILNCIGDSTKRGQNKKNIMKGKNNDTREMRIGLRIARLEEKKLKEDVLGVDGMILILGGNVLIPR